MTHHYQEVARQPDDDLTPSERQELRLVLEQNRLRRRIGAAMRRWMAYIGGGAAIGVALSQLTDVAARLLLLVKGG